MPDATVILPRSLIALFPGSERRVTVGGTTVAEVIAGLDARWPGMRDRLCGPGPALRDFINIFVDGEPARLETPVGPGATIHVLPAIAGG